jgi:hypothetical protein
MRRVLWLAISATLLGCSGSGEGLDENGRPLDSGPLPLVPTFASIQQNVFTPICTRCHAGAAAPTGLRLDEASSYAMLVNVASVEVPGLRRIRPGDPDVSYLVQKIEGRAAVGGRMPLNSPPLPQATIDVIKQWIREGAPRSAASTSPQSPATISSVTPLDDQIIDGAPREIIVQSATVRSCARHDIDQHRQRLAATQRWRWQLRGRQRNRCRAAAFRGALGRADCHCDHAFAG